MGRSFTVGILIVIWGSAISIAQEKYTPQELQTFFGRVAKQYQFQPAKLDLEEPPILHWSNPVRMQNQGGVYVWTMEGRPIVIASIFSFEFSGRVRYRHEIYSLADFPLTASLNQRVVWQPVATDAQWQQLDFSPPAPSISRRLAQMRAIARQFSGEVTEKTGGINKLKLMPQPLMRYRSESQGLIDGAIFGLSVATDPEIYLLVEAYQDEKRDPLWRFVAIPSSYLALKLRRGDELVWSQEANMSLENTMEGAQPHAAKPYFTFFSNDPLPPPEDLREEN